MQLRRVDDSKLRSVREAKRTPRGSILSLICSTQLKRLLQVWGKDMDAVCMCVTPICAILITVTKILTFRSFEGEVLSALLVFHTWPTEILKLHTIISSDENIAEANRDGVEGDAERGKEEDSRDLRVKIEDVVRRIHRYGRCRHAWRDSVTWLWFFQS